MNNLDIAIPPEVFPSLSAIFRTRAEWNAIRSGLEHQEKVQLYLDEPSAEAGASAEESSILVSEFESGGEDDSGFFDADAYDEVAAHSSELTLQSRQDQLIEAAVAIGVLVESVEQKQAMMLVPPPSIWKVPGGQALIGMNMVVLACAIMLAALSYRNLNATTKVVALIEEVENVGKMETRISNMLDKSNLGVQTMIAQTNDRITYLQTQVSALPADTKGIVKELGDIAKDMLRIPAQMTTAQELMPASGEPAPMVAHAPKPKRVSVRNTTVAAAEIAAPRPMPSASKAFRRIVTADGSIKFEKIR